MMMVATEELRRTASSIREGLTTETQIKLTLSNALGEWSETYPAPVEQEHQKWASQIVYNFNEARRQGELKRTLVSVEVITPKGEVLATTGHDWILVGPIPVKRATAMTALSAYKCNNCGVTGIRKGNEWPPTPDKQFKGRWFASCDKAREYIPLNQEERMRYRNRILGEERWRKNLSRRRGC